MNRMNPLSTTCESTYERHVMMEKRAKPDTPTINRKRYYISFTDDYSRYSNIYFLHAKDEAFNAYQYYEAWMKTQHDVHIKSLRSDQGGEYLSEEFSDHLKKAGTTRKLTVHDTPEYNGVAERLNRTIITVRAMLHDSDL